MSDWIAKLSELKQSGHPFVMVTVADATGSTPREVGAKMFVLADGSFFGTIGGGHLEQLAIEEAKKCISDEKSLSIRYPLGAKTGQCCGGVVTLLFETLNLQPRLYLFGAGHVGQAVCRTLQGTPFDVHVVDDRPEWIQSSELPRAVTRHPCEWEDFVAEAAWDDRKTYVAIMTHRHDTDEAILSDVLRRPTRYVGLIGSPAKWHRFRDRLAARKFSEMELARVHCPIGLDIGGQRPQEVAVSLAAQLLGVHYGK